MLAFLRKAAGYTLLVVVLVTMINHPVESANIIRSIGSGIGAISDSVAQLGSNVSQP